ncbi:hypothetical protein [Streptomyces sp. NBC_01764]|nr:hypothetical protein [Streptomyces sp. NBC_01764]
MSCEHCVAGITEEVSEVPGAHFVRSSKPPVRNPGRSSRCG